jgi:hypothetical protein
LVRTASFKPAAAAAVAVTGSAAASGAGGASGGGGLTKVRSFASRAGAATGVGGSSPRLVGADGGSSKALTSARIDASAAAKLDDKLVTTTAPANSLMRHEMLEVR